MHELSVSILQYMCPHYVLILLLCMCHTPVYRFGKGFACTNSVSAYYTTTMCVFIMSSSYCYVCVILLLCIDSACTNSASAYYTTTIRVSSLYPHTAAISVLRVHELGRPPPHKLNILCTVTKPHMRSPTALILLFTMPSAYRFGGACN